MQERKQIGLLVIATRKYKQFFPQLLEGVKRYFLLNHKIKVFLFSDQFGLYDGDGRVSVDQHIIPAYKYPEATLYRYVTFLQQREALAKMDFLFYVDVDMSIVGEVTDVILVDGLMAVRHPGFFINDGWGDSNNSEQSKSFLPKEKRKHYYCGGTQGGAAVSYIVASMNMASGINKDENNGVRAEWNDETFWNHELHTTQDKVFEFTPSLCMPEPNILRIAWGLTELKPIILALDKDHKSIRE